MFKRVRKAWNKVEKWAEEEDQTPPEAPTEEGLTVAAAAAQSQAESEVKVEKVKYSYTNRATPSAPYTYAPLPGDVKKPIRHLTLLPGPPDADIQCQLTVADLDGVESGSPFEALSYVWGDDKDKSPIQVDGATIAVTRNLRSALLHLRKQDQPRTLWVDAVCINQNDTDECNTQVPLMGEIYTRASRTFVWLGCPCCLLGAPRPDLSAFARNQLGEQVGKVEILFNILHHLDKEAGIVAAEGSEIIPEKGIEYTDGTTTYEWVKKGDPAWDLIFFDNPWWKRVWTLQEIVLTRQAVLCMGRREVEWASFLNAITYYKALGFTYFDEHWFGTTRNSSLEPLNMVNSIKAFRAARQTEQVRGGDVGDELLYYLASSHWRDCGKASDKIYGVLGLLGNDCDVGIVVDYRTDPADVYRDATKALMQRCGNLDVFGFCHPFKTSRVSGMPSWVPDWGSSGNLAGPLMNDARRIPRTTHAAKGSRSDPRWEDDNDRSLVLQGYVIDTVEKLGSVQPAPILNDRNEGSLDHLLKDPEMVAAAESLATVQDRTDPEHPWTRELMSEWWKILKITPSFYKKAFSELASAVTHQERYIEWQDLVTAELKRAGHPNPIAVFRDTLTTSTLHPAGPAETQRRFEEWLKLQSSVRKLKGVKLDRFAPGTFKTLAFVIGCWRAVDEDEESFSNYTSHTERRRMGVTLAGRVCLLPSRTEVADQVMLMRGGRVPLVLRPRGDGTTELIGEAYVHGIMDGEAFDEAACVQVRIR